MADKELDAELAFRNCAYLPKNSEHEVAVCCKRSLKIRPKERKIYLRWVELLPREKRHVERDRIYTLAALFAESKYHQTVVYNEWIQQLYECRKFQDVLFVCEKAFDKVDNPIDLKNVCGLCYLFLGDYEKAMAIFEKTGKLNRKFKSGPLNEALAFCAKGEYEKAVEKFEECGYAALFETSYRKEIEGLKKDLEKEENEEIKLRLEGFQKIVEMFDKKRRLKKSEEE